MIRVVVQHAPNLYAIIGMVDPNEDGLPPTLEIEARTYYRTETHDRWVLYRAALSGWGGMTNDEGGRVRPDPRQQ